MSKHSLPREVSPLKYADQGRTLSGVIALSQLPRVMGVIEDGHDGDVEIELEFSCDEQRQRLLKGKLGASVSLLCQRCLEPVRLPVRSEFTLGMVLNDEQARNLPKSYEPLMVEPEHLDLYDVVEEELLLSLPMFAYHEQCQTQMGKTVDAEEVELTKKPNPFSVLSVLKQNQKQG